MDKLEFRALLISSIVNFHTEVPNATARAEMAADEIIGNLEKRAKSIEGMFDMEADDNGMAIKLNWL